VTQSVRLPSRLLVLLLFAPAAAPAQEPTLDGAVWSFPALRSLRNAVNADSTLAPALGACREAASTQQAHVVTLMRRRADSLTTAAGDSLRFYADRHAGYPPTQHEATCLLAVADSLPGLYSRQASLGRIEEMVGLLRSGRLDDARRGAFQRLLQSASRSGGRLEDLSVRQQLAQEEIVAFLGRQIEENAALRRSMPLPSLSRPASMLSMVMFPVSYPGSLLGKTIEITFTVTPEGGVADVKLSPEISDARFRAIMMESLVKYRFRPALDRYGQPGPSKYSITYRFGREANRP
jgi:hypothetical protein